MLTLPAQAQNGHVYSGIDSVKNIRWEVELLSTYDDSLYTWSDYVRKEYYLNTSDRVLLICLPDTTEIGPPVPESCLRKVKTDPSMIFLAAAPKMKDQQQVSGPRPDSIIIVDQAALRRYRREHPELRSDTIHFRSGKQFGRALQQELKLKRICTYKKGLKHGKERVYYNTKELNGLSIPPTSLGYAPFRLKYKGRWKKGEQHGRWKYYTEHHTVLEVRIYRKGKIIHSRRTQEGKGEAWKDFWRKRPLDSP